MNNDEKENMTYSGYTSAFLERYSREELIIVWRSEGTNMFYLHGSDGSNKFNPALLSTYFRILYYIKTIRPTAMNVQPHVLV